ncbi:Protein FAR1-RELATED SEQUENCE 11 [Senna tora]|uniref:Protein FAR1-RELATED SEQUENCE 11 n=1 Tax=Senna tora TaxID=362788 RepID=A0A834W6Q5_9FABA|nr:Protein FAR1-RELATED SEQUENCE 11 [Senna tora]
MMLDAATEKACIDEEFHSNPYDEKYSKCGGKVSPKIQNAYNYM